MLLKPLARWQVDDAVLGMRRAVDRADELDVLAARGMLPHGTVGGVTHHRRGIAMGPLVEQARALPIEEPVEVRIAGDGWVLTGVLDRLTGEDQRYVTPSSIKTNGKHWMSPWLHHLCLCAMAAEDAGLPRETRAFGKDGEVTFGFVADALEHLDELVHGMAAGLREPFAFFPNASFDYAGKLPEVTGKEKDMDAELSSLRSAFTKPGFGDAPDPEGLDHAVALVFRDRHPLDDAGFVEWARRVCAPMLEAAGLSKVSPHP